MIVSFICQKGGVSKTTTTACFAAVLQKKGYSTLLVDTDAQCTLSKLANTKIDTLTIADVFNGEPVASAIQHTPQYGDVLACSKAFTGLDAKLSASDVKEFVAELNKLKEYDFVLIDTPPAVSVLTYGVAASCDKIIVPLGADAACYDALQDLITNFEDVNIVNKIAGVLITRWQKTALSRDVDIAIKAYCLAKKIKVANSIISEGVVMKELIAIRENLFTYASKSKQIQQYLDAVTELLEVK